MGSFVKNRGEKAPAIVILKWKCYNVEELTKGSFYF
jgi:hypothetical protein